MKVLNFEEYIEQTNESLLNRITGKGMKNDHIVNLVKKMVTYVIDNFYLLKKYKSEIDNIVETIKCGEAGNICFFGLINKYKPIFDAITYEKRIIVEDVPKDHLSIRESEKIKDMILNETKLGALYVFLQSKDDTGYADMFEKWCKDLKYLKYYNFWGYNNLEAESSDSYYEVTFNIADLKLSEDYLRFTFGDTRFDGTFFFKEEDKKLAEKCASKFNGSINLKQVSEKAKEKNLNKNNNKYSY